MSLSAPARPNPILPLNPVFLTGTYKTTSEWNKQVEDILDNPYPLACTSIEDFTRKLQWEEEVIAYIKKLNLIIEFYEEENKESIDVF